MLASFSANPLLDHPASEFLPTHRLAREERRGPSRHDELALIQVNETCSSIVENMDAEENVAGVKDPPWRQNIGELL